VIVRVDRALDHPELGEAIHQLGGAPAGAVTRPELKQFVHPFDRPGVNGRRMLSIVKEEKLRRILSVMLDEAEFLGPHGIRSMSRRHTQHPYVFRAGGQEFSGRASAAQIRNGSEMSGRKPQDVGFVRWLFDHPFDPEFGGPHGDLGRGQTSDEQDWHGTSDGAEVFHEFKPGQVRHILIEYQAGRRFRRIFEKVERGTEGRHPVAGDFEHESEGIENGRIVIDHAYDAGVVLLHSL